MAKDYYAALGLDKSASGADIKKAYRKLAQKYHPDKNPDDKAAEERFKEITEAYAVLSDPEKKKKYDTYGDESFHQQYSQEDIFRGADLGDIFREFDLGGDIFSQIFGSRGGGARHGHATYGRGGFQTKGPDYSLKVRIPFRQAVLGGERRISYKSEHGDEQLNVRIPPGAETGSRLRVPKKGGVSPTGGPPGDLILEIIVDRDSRFTREGNDIFTNVTVPFSGACLGTSVTVPTLNESKRVKVKPGMQCGDKIRLKDFGVPGGGDLYAVINVDVPKKLSAKQKELLEQLKEEGL